MYPLFGGYWGYLAAPLVKVTQHRLRIIARKRVEARHQAEHQAQQAERQAEIERLRGRR